MTLSRAMVSQLWLAWPFEKEGEIYSAPDVLETTNRYKENDGVSLSKRVHELALGIVICFLHGVRV